MRTYYTVIDLSSIENNAQWRKMASDPLEYDKLSSVDTINVTHAATGNTLASFVEVLEDTLKKAEPILSVCSGLSDVNVHLTWSRYFFSCMETHGTLVSHFCNSFVGRSNNGHQQPMTIRGAKWAISTEVYLDDDADLFRSVVDEYKYCLHIKHTIDVKKIDQAEWSGWNDNASSADDYDTRTAADIEPVGRALASILGAGLHGELATGLHSVIVPLKVLIC